MPQCTRGATYRIGEAGAPLHFPYMIRFLRYRFTQEYVQCLYTCSRWHTWPNLHPWPYLCTRASAVYYTLFLTHAGLYTRDLIHTPEVHDIRYPTHTYAVPVRTRYHPHGCSTHVISFKQCCAGVKKRPRMQPILHALHTLETQVHIRKVFILGRCLILPLSYPSAGK